MTEPKDIHRLEQEAAANDERTKAATELIEGMVQLAAATAAYFNRLVDDGLERWEALELTMCYINATSGRTIDAEDDIPGEDWKKRP